LTPRTFWELLADSLLLLKEDCVEWAAIIAAGLLPGLAASTTAFLALGLTDMAAIKNAIAAGAPSTLLPLLTAGLLDKACNALALMALVRAAAARDEGRVLGLKRAYAEAAPLFFPFLLAQLRALLSICWGLIRLIWPGLKLCVLYSFVPLAVLVNGATGKQALQQSAEAAANDPVKTAGNLALAALLASLAYSVLAVILTALMTFPRVSVPGGESLPEAMLLGFVNQLLAGLVFGWLASFAILLYRDLSQSLKT
jgi:hypothetical protein